MEKFSRNRQCFVVVEATNNIILDEVFLYAKLWGLSMKDPNLANMKLWKRDNLLENRRG